MENEQPNLTDMQQRIAARLEQEIKESSSRSSAAHADFLKNRRGVMQTLAGLTDAAATPGTAASAALITRRQVEELASGSMAAGLGDEYLVFEGRRYPRLPNGRLLMVDRAVAYRGERHRFDIPVEMDVEVDLPADAWYFQEDAGSNLPYSLLMEAALQACGLLSAYQGTSLRAVDEDFYFRNLDGEAEILQFMDLRGQTLQTRTRLTRSSFNLGMIVQKFEFETSCRGQMLYRGWSVFGYFQRESVNRQLGLDGGAPRPLWGEANGSAFDVRYRLDDEDARRVLFPPVNNGCRLNSGLLSLIDEIAVSRDGGAHGLGYAAAWKRISPQDWFFSNHFYQDPVMPGSLGVEAALDTLRAAALAKGLCQGLRSPRFIQGVNQPFAWKYRGQALPDAKTMALETHITGIERQIGGSLLVRADASLWAGQTRIYALEGMSLGIMEG